MKLKIDDLDNLLITFESDDFEFINQITKELGYNLWEQRDELI